MTLKEIYQSTCSKLQKNGIERPELEAEWLIEKFLGKTTLDVIKDPTEPLDLNPGFRTALERRLLGEPLAYILEEKEFCGHNFYVDKNVLIPRPETELLVEQVLLWPNFHEAKKIADLGTGSGCILICLLLKLPQATGVGVDISAGAIEVARRNAEALGAGQRLSWLNQDVVQTKLTDEFDIIVANPPYIDPNDENIAEDVRRFEPATALFAPQGISILRAWLQHMTPRLKSRGLFAMEIGYDQGQIVMDLFNSLGLFSKVILKKDYSGKDRIVLAERS